MKLPQIIGLMGAFSSLALASGLNTNTNQSAAYLRNVARYATTEADAPYYNPAGTAFMTDGFHISLNSQAFWQSRNTYTESPLFGGEKKFRGKAQIPAMPSALVTWHRGNFALSGYFGITGGGGALNYKDGFPSFDVAVAQIPGMLTQNGLETTDYDADISLTGTSYIFGFALGASYRIVDFASIYLGARFNYAYNHYEGELKNIKVNPKNELLGLDGSMVEAASTFKNISEYLAGKAGEAAGAAEQYAAAAEKYAAAGDKASAAQSKAAAEQYSATAEELMVKSKTLEAVAEQVSDRELDVEQTGYGITPIAALAINYKRLSFGLRFEYNTSIEMENDTKVNQVGLDNYNDGVKTDNDIPASIYAGITYSLLDNLRLSLGYGHWFDSKANLPGKQEKYADDTDEFLYGVEVDFLTRWTLSGGVQVTRYHLSDEYLSEMNIILDNTTFGFGLAFRATDWLKFNLGYFHSLYNDWEEKVEYGKNTYKRESRGVGVGIDLDI